MLLCHTMCQDVGGKIYANVLHFLASEQIPPIDADHLFLGELSLDGSLRHTNVRGQEHVKRALEVAAAGSHNVLMSGPPGAGKTLLARCMPSILPRMTNAGLVRFVLFGRHTGYRLSEGDVPDSTTTDY